MPEDFNQLPYAMSL